MLEMMRLAEEARDVGGQRRDHLLALIGAFAGRDERAIFAEALQPERAQALGEPGIDERGLRLGQVNARIGMQHRRHAGGGLGAQHRPVEHEADGLIPLGAGLRALAQAALLSEGGTMSSSATRLIMRPSTRKTPRTKVSAMSETMSGVGCTRSSVTVMMS